MPIPLRADCIKRTDDVLEHELLVLIKWHNPACFERLVVDLLEVMRCGEGKVGAYAGNERVDDPIPTDELWFRLVYTQAKRYATGHKVGRSQLFVGVLNRERNGAFISTSSFTAEVLDYVKNCPNVTLAPMDGKRFANLMIKSSLSVTTESIVKIKPANSGYSEKGWAA